MTERVTGDANQMQVGGTHYKTGYEHWDWVLDVGLGYLEGNATRYVSRWRKKEGLQDLQKALHYANKSIETYSLMRRRPEPLSVANRSDQTHRFAAANTLTELEEEICVSYALWNSLEDLIVGRDLILKLIEVANAPPAEPKPVPLEDSNKHADRHAGKVSFDRTDPT